MDNHPGSIVFVDSVTGKEETRPVSEVPEHSRFAPDRTGTPVPVVRVVTTGDSQIRAVQEYGADGALLRSTSRYMHGA